MGPIVTQNELARTLGVAKSTLSELLRRPDWPDAVPRTPPWSEEHVAALERFREGLQEDRSGKAPSAEASQREKVEVALKFQRQRKAKVDADLAEGRVIDRETADDAVIRIAGLFRNHVDNLRDTLLQELPGDLAVIEPILRRRFGEMMTAVLADAEQGLNLVDAELEEMKARRKK